MSRKVNVRISDYGGRNLREFEILERNKIEDILLEVDEHGIHRRCIDLADKYSSSGIAYVYIDVRDGSIKEDWIQSNSELHPWDDFYRIVLAGVRSPIDWSNFYDQDWIDPTSEEWDEFQKWSEENYGTAEDFILEKYGEEELEKRRDWVVDFWIDNLELREDIDDQVDLLYAHAVK